MSKRKKNKKIRTDFKQRYDDRTRQNDLTREFNDSDHETTESHERISGKGKLARKRTIRGEEVESDEGTEIILEIDDLCRPGLVLSVHGFKTVLLKPKTVMSLNVRLGSFLKRSARISDTLLLRVTISSFDLKQTAQKRDLLCELSHDSEQLVGRAERSSTSLQPISNKC